MQQTRLLMGMPITVEIVDAKATATDLQQIFNYFIYIDEKFSTYKTNSEISQINQGLILPDQYSKDMQTVLKLSTQTKQQTKGYFDIWHNSQLDPSGLVKGWAIYQASLLLKKHGFSNFYIEAGGDIQIVGKNKEAKTWTVGIRNPFNRTEIIKVLAVVDYGVATSGTYVRGQHIYNPYQPKAKLTEFVSLTVLGPNVYEADRFATAAFAMGKQGINFLENLPGFEGYLIDCQGIATYTSGFDKYVLN